MWPSSVWAASEIPAAGYTALPIRLKHSLPCSASCGLQRGEKKKNKNKINKEIKACGDSCWAAVEPEEQQPCEWKSTAQHWPQLCVFLPFTRLSFSLRLFKNVDRKRCNLPARRLLQLMPVYAMSTELETRYFTHFWDWATQCVLWHWRSFFSHEIMNKRTDRKGGGGGCRPTPGTNQSIVAGYQHSVASALWKLLPSVHPWACRSSNEVFVMGCRCCRQSKLSLGLGLRGTGETDYVQSESCDVIC